MPSKSQSPPTPFSSPIQEQHIDFLLEEEFSCNASFLAFFLAQARARTLPARLGTELIARMTPYETWDCQAVRSATTNAGETDVLVVFRSANPSSPRVGILIENKIRAPFQKTQAARYQERGQAGQPELWDHFFTCLVAPENYSKDNAGFDAFVSLESISKFFSAEAHRPQFKAQVIQRALANFAPSGIKNVDLVMTKFRAAYAHAAGEFFEAGEVVWEPARDAWYDDSWFYFRHADLPLRCKIVYKSKAGAVELSFANADAANLQRILTEAPSSEGLEASQTGKSAALRVSLSPISDFVDLAGAATEIHQSLEGVRTLLAFHKRNAELFRKAGSVSWT